MNPHFDALIIGGGIFGQVIAARLRHTGFDVGVIDPKYEGAGSKPAACLMKPSWFSSMGKKNYKPALETLHELYDVETIKFKTGPVTHEVLWINPRHILEPSGHTCDIDAAVIGISNDGKKDKRFIVALHDGRELTSTHLICAAGMWCNNLLQSKVPGLTAKTGAAFLWRTKEISQPFIRPWAPFKQVVAFNRGDGLWVGDGSAIIPKNWTPERQEKSLMRCAEAVGREWQHANAVELVGNRPYAQTSNPCYLARHSGVWVATGGAKNGTIGAGWAADQIAKNIS